MALFAKWGACQFSDDGQVGETLCVNVDARSCLAIGMDFNPETIYWWLEQSKEAQLSILKEPRLPITTALVKLNTVAKGTKKMWSHESFDWAILRHHYEKAGIKCLIHHRDAQDLRTLVDLAQTPYDKGQFVRVGIQHNALDDCLFQVKYASAAITRIKRGLAWLKQEEGFQC